jgi:GMP synthase-like glutamine amidotransferase
MEALLSQDQLDYYEVLACSPNASFEIIQQHYRALARQYHPDRTKTQDTSSKKHGQNLSYIYRYLMFFPLTNRILSDSRSVSSLIPSTSPFHV